MAGDIRGRLKVNKSLLAARIFSIADVYDSWYLTDLTDKPGQKRKPCSSTPVKNLAPSWIQDL
jgi:hypothetical protein